MAANPTSARHNPPVEFLPCEQEHRGAPGSTGTPTRLTLEPCAAQTGASENQDDFSYHLPPLTPADMQDAVSRVLLKGKAASSLHRNSEE